ncbi:hypothetical protein BU25DRAFT_462735 [Macroventuria anomochaeta]|uniref:Uncharacterized protein n=1 Tax=Macroventuria anomochaeta TaxID=301207 RepID=A0ACB6RNA3_9PLEO|nr:uncharacterized protein BU25DRAFT_462735 [Macroventuria anomochaeta]KAF2622634.1 hypothetical protein BU25DRAFT_462735 [Macroventuria anomochaeta]
MTSDSTSTPTDKSSAANHRERKEVYIHALESEVLALRTKARSVQEQNDALGLEVAQLRSRLDTQQTPIHCMDWDTEWFGGDVDAGSTNTSYNNEEQWPSMPAGVLTWGRESVVEDVPNEACNAVVRRPSTSQSWSMSASHADMAMEFVLTLEKPCIQRAQSVVFDPLNPYPLDHHAGPSELAAYHSFVEDQLIASESCTKDDIASSLDNLLSLSSAFCLANEVTPIQAWHQLCKYLEFGAVDTKRFRALVDALLEHVRCYGFGAVISRSVLDASCRRVFTIGN